MLIILIRYPEILVCGLGFLASATWLAWRPQCKKAGLLVIACLFGMIGPPVATMILSALTPLRPMKLDAYVFWADGWLGFQPSFRAGVLLHQYAWLKLAAMLTYNVLPAVYVGVFALYLAFRSLREAGGVALVFAINLFAALPIYLLFPVGGPRAAFAGFPAVPHHVALRLMTFNGVPNAMPSVHFSSALLILWYLRRWRAGYSFGVLFAILTILATLGSGEHYFFDLVMAVPYAAAVCVAVTRSMHRADASVIDHDPTKRGPGCVLPPAIPEEDFFNVVM